MATTNEGSTEESAPAKKRPAARKRAPARKSASSNASSSAPRRSSSRSTGSRRTSASQIAGLAARELVALVGRELEGVTGMERSEDGWTVTVDVLELHRVPETTDVLASYEVTVDESGDLLGYRRTHRFVRGTPGQG